MRYETICSDGRLINGLGAFGNAIPSGQDTLVAQPETRTDQQDK
jgi:hypothetical protein